MLGDERLSRCAAGNRLHHRCLDLHESARVQKVSNFGNDLTAFEEDVLHLIVAHQVEVTLAVANLGVFESVPFGWRRAQSLGKNHECGELDRNFTGFGGEHRAAHADEIAEVEVFEDIELFVAERLLLGVNLDPCTALRATSVFDVNELALAHVAVRGDAPGQRDFAALGIIGARLSAVFRGCKFVFERVDALGPQCGELGLALFNQCIRVVHSHLQTPIKHGARRVVQGFDTRGLPLSCRTLPSARTREGEPIFDSA